MKAVHSLILLGTIFVISGAGCAGARNERANHRTSNENSLGTNGAGSKDSGEEMSSKDREDPSKSATLKDPAFPNLKLLGLGWDHNNTICGITSDNKVKCWGGNVNQVATPPPGLENVSMLALSSSNACAVADSTVHCWGGLASPTENLIGVKSLAVGYDAACAIIADGTVHCWGDTQVAKNVPNSGDQFTKISIGSDHACALTTSGLVRCWGANTYQQLAVPSGLSQVIDIVAYYASSCAATSDEIVCWGQKNPAVDSIPDELKDLKQVHMTNQTICAASSIGVKCWGNLSPLEGLDMNAVDPSSFKLASNGACYLKDGKAICGGFMGDYTPSPETLGSIKSVASYWGAIGLLTTNGVFVDGKKIAFTATNIEKIAMGSDFVCALSDGKVECSAQRDDREGFEPILPPDLEKVTDIKAAGHNLCVLSEKQLSCYASKDESALKPPSDLTDVSMFDVAAKHACAVTSGAKVLCWGDIGNPSIDLAAVTGLTTGDNQNCVISDGRVYCWGFSNVTSTLTNQTSPNPNLNVPFNVVEAESVWSVNSTCALTKAKGLVCWGPDEELEILSPPSVSSAEQFGLDKFYSWSIDRDSGRVTLGSGPQWGLVYQGLIPGQ